MADGTWLVEPIEPLVFGDGRSIGTTTIAGTRVLPPPSQLAGTVRSQVWSSVASDDASRQQAVLRLDVVGPVGARLDEDGSIVDWWLPAPQDARLMEGGEFSRLVPLALPEGCAWGPLEAPAVGSPTVDRRKPVQASRFWSWRHGLRPWLVGNAPEPGWDALAPALDLRTHVAMGPNDTALEEDALFGVTGMAFAPVRRKLGVHPWGGPEHERARLGLVLRTSAPLPDEVVHPLGGEQRLARWRRLSSDPWPAIPAEVVASAEQGHVRIYLATPAWFTAGHVPDASVLFAGIDGGVLASVSERPEVVSGWDQRLNGPKPTRRLVPAGAVLFVRLGGDEAQRRRWAEKTWLACISDDEQSRRDGFGLALLGTWDGQCHEIEIPMEDP
jgi:CRISPR-associated protein Cmr3